MRALIAALVASAALVTPLAASCTAPTADRQGPNGAQPDGYQDQTHVVIYRAPDQVPNVAVFCVGAYGFVSSLKNSESSSGGATPSLLRFSEYDKTCANG